MIYIVFFFGVVKAMIRPAIVIMTSEGSGCRQEWIRGAVDGEGAREARRVGGWVGG